MNKIRILIADDHKLVREAWAEILDADPRFMVVALCGDGQEAVELAKKFFPEIVLMDINMAPLSGLDATHKILKVSPASRIIAVSMYSRPEYAKKMLQLGAKGYVTKNSTREEMMLAILEVNSGNKYICNEIKNIISENAMVDKYDSPNINMLTGRELQVINLIKDGASSREIANAFLISLKTVEVHRHNILKKLKLRNAASLVNFINSTAPFMQGISD